MSCISGIDKKPTYTILSAQFPSKAIRYYAWGHEDLDMATQEKANKIFKNKNCPQALEKLPRVYLQRNGIVYSGIRPVFYRADGYRNHLDSRYGLLIIHGSKLAAAVFESGRMTTAKIYPQPIQPLPENIRYKQSHHVDCTSILKSWLSDNNCWWQGIFYCCSERYDCDIQAISKDKSISFYKVPFTARTASTEELNRIWTKLFCVVEHGTSQKFKKALSTYKKRQDTEAECSQQDIRFTPLTKGQRKAEKQHWPGISSRMKNKIHEALLTNNYEEMQDVIEIDPETIDYLSFVHKKLDNQSFLHYATKENLTETVKYLLDVGCDQNVKNSNGTVPYYLAKSDEMKQVYEDYENGDSTEDMWEKSETIDQVDSRERNNKKSRKPKKEIKRRKNRRRIKHKNAELCDFSLKFGRKHKPQHQTCKIKSPVNKSPSNKASIPSEPDEVHTSGLTPLQIRDVQIAMCKNSYGTIKKLHRRIYPGVIDYLYEPQSILGGQTYLHVAANEGLYNTLKFLLERFPPWRRDIRDWSQSRAIDYCKNEKTKAVFERADELQRAYYDRYPKKRNKLL